jgi:hypothetical protein
MLARVHDQEIEIGEGPMPPPRELASAVRASSSRPERRIGLNSRIWFLRHPPSRQAPKDLDILAVGRCSAAKGERDPI